MSKLYRCTHALSCWLPDECRHSNWHKKDKKCNFSKCSIVYGHRSCNKRPEKKKEGIMKKAALNKIEQAVVKLYVSGKGPWEVITKISKKYNVSFSLNKFDNIIRKAIIILQTGKINNA